MSSLRSKTGRYDKQSIKLRKELEQLAKKSKDEFEILKDSEKTEILLREGLLAQKTKRGSEKRRDFEDTDVKDLASTTNAKVEEFIEGCPPPKERFIQASRLQNKPQNPPPSPMASSKKIGSGRVKVKSAKRENELKRKTPLHEKRVVSIRPDNPELKVVMQGRKVKKNTTETNELKCDEEKLETVPKFDGMFFHYQPLSPVNIPAMHGAAKIAIIGSQNTSMRAPLTQRKQPGERAVNSASSFNTQRLEDDAFMFHWSSEGSESITTLTCDEGRQLSPFAAVTSENEGTAIVSERSDHLENKRMDPSMTIDVGEKAEGRLLSACEQPKEEIQQISEKFQRGSAYAGAKVTPGADISKLIKDEAKEEFPIKETNINLKGSLDEEQTETLENKQGFEEVDVAIEIASIDKSHKQDISPGSLQISDAHGNEMKRDEDNNKMGVEEALQELSLPLKVTVSDIINVSGKKALLLEKSSNDHTKKYVTVEPQSCDHDNDVTFLSTWQETGIAAPVKTGKKSTMKIHHFCSQNSTVELPAHLTRVSRDMHTVDKHRAVAQRYETTQETLPRVFPILETYRCSKRVEPEEELQGATGECVFERRLSEVAEDILVNAANQAELLKRLQSTADRMFSASEDEPLNIHGVKIYLKDDSTRYYWTPAPPKFHLTPSFVRDQMFPGYEGAPVFKDTIATEYEPTETMHGDSEDNEDNLDKMDPEDHEARERVLQRTHGSMSNIMEKLSRKPEKSVTKAQPSNVTLLDINQDHGEEGTTAGERFVSVLDVRRQMARMKDSLRNVEIETGESDDDKWFSNLNLQRRPQSQPDLSNEQNLCVQSDYHTSMQELDEQAELVSAMKSEKKSPESIKKPKTSRKDEILQEKRDSFDCSFSLNTDSILQGSYTDKKDDAVTEINSVNTTTTKGEFSLKKKSFPKSYPAHRNKTKRESSTLELERLKRKQQIQKKTQEFLDRPPRTIKRSESFHLLSGVRSLKRTYSVPCVMDYQSLHNENTSEDDLFFWVQDNYWYKWLDEVIPPSPAVADILRDTMSSVSGTEQGRSSILSNVLDEIEVIEPHIDETNRQLYEDLEKEAENVSGWIDQTESEETLALYLARRGAIYRKLGQLKNAWDDLERSIQLEPQLLDSHWHRHLLLLLNNKPTKALEDLTYIIKKNRNCAKAYRSRADIYRSQGDSTMAVLNYSQAIKLNPDEAEIYYRRASVFEERGDIILALEDYKTASELMPSKTEAMFNIGRYHFEQNNWPAAEKSFTKMLKQDPLDAKAYLYRGKVWAQQGVFNNSVKDLSCAIHLDPRNAEAFYHRGCLLRLVNPQKAIQDLSVSLLLDNGNENVNAFLHRGIIYTDLKRWDEAVNDFESALRLDRCIPSAHVNIGLLLITKHGNYPRAIKRFSSAIRVDPTYIRGYICRADAYDKTGHLKESIDDYTKAIHLRPDVADYRMSRGKVLLKQNKLELASFHIRQAAELSHGLGGSATQQAVVHAFLKDFDRAVDILTKATRINPSAPMYILLGKTYMKAKKYENAIASFKRAIYCLTPWHPRIAMPLSAGTVHFLIGTCYTELNNLVNALDAFNNAIKVNPEDAEAYYNRGLTKMKLRHAKSIHDFNRALAINPKLFQAFLSRAAYYGMKGRFSKGIMNCNEAIKLQPRSVRAYLYRGALKFHISAYKLAVRDLTEAIAIDCTCSLAYFNRAVCYQAMKFYQKALVDYSIVLLTSKEPDLKVLQNRGLLYLDINDIENALKDFKEADKVSPNNPKLLHTLGLCYHKLNRLEDAVNSFTEALQVNPFFIEAHIGRGNTLMDYGHDTATRLGRCDYVKALHLDPSCLTARVNLAYNLQVESKFQQAWHQFTSALSIDKDCQAALEGRAIVNLQMGNTFGAFVDMNDCLKVSKTAELLTNRGVVQQFMGDTVNAMRDYQAAIQLDPRYSLAYYNAANLYFKQRQFKQALVFYEKASSWNPQDESAVLNAAITKVLLKQFEPALCSFQKAIELSPNSAHIYFNRGNVYASLGQYEKAEEDYTTALQLCPGDALTYKRRADVRGKMSRREEAIEDYRKAITIQTTVRKK